LMCTGDALLTAVEVARQVSIVMKKHVVYNLQKRDSSTATKKIDPLTNFEFVALDQNASVPLELSSNDMENLSRMRAEASFSVTGDVLVQVAAAAVTASHSKNQHLDEKHVLLHPDAQSVLAKLVPLVSVFARHAPHQKEAVIAAFNHGGYCTLMCGGENTLHANKTRLVLLF
jgi:magnesium-transporting ATPase (P-type)